MVLVVFTDFKELTIDEAIIRYYHMENLDIERKRLYREVLKSQAGQGVTAKEQELLNIVSATLTFGGIGLILLALLKKTKTEINTLIKSPFKYIYGNLVGLGIDSTLFPIAQLQPKGIKNSRALANILAKSISIGTSVTITLCKKLYYNTIKPIAKNVNNKIIKPFTKNVVKPVIKKVVKPAIQYVHSKIIKPVYNKVVNSVAKPVYRKMVKPAAKSVHRNVVKLVTKLIKNKIAKPIGKFFKRLWK